MPPCQAGEFSFFLSWVFAHLQRSKPQALLKCLTPWAEDRALLGSNPSAAPGAGSKPGGALPPPACLSSRRPELALSCQAKNPRGSGGLVPQESTPRVLVPTSWSTQPSSRLSTFRSTIYSGFRLLRMPMKGNSKNAPFTLTWVGTRPPNTGSRPRSFEVEDVVVMFLRDLSLR